MAATEEGRGDELGGDIPVSNEDLVLPSSASPTPSVAPPGDRSRRWLVPVLSAALVVSLASAAVFGTMYLTQGVSGEAIDEVLDAEAREAADVAGTVANLLLNYDSTNLEEVAERMLAVATGNFREQYEEVLSQGAGLGAALEEASASSRGEILEGPDIYFRHASEGIAIVRVTQTAQSSSNPTGQTIDYVLKITLIDTETDGWKADRVEVLSTQQV